MLLGVFYFFVMCCMVRGIRHSTHIEKEDLRKKRCLHSDDFLPLGCTRLLESITEEEDMSAVYFTTIAIPIAYIAIVSILVRVFQVIINAYVEADNPGEESHEGITYFQVLSVVWIAEFTFLTFFVCFSCCRNLYKKSKRINNVYAYIENTYVDLTPEEKEYQKKILMDDPETADALMRERPAATPTTGPAIVPNGTVQPTTGVLENVTKQSTQNATVPSPYGRELSESKKRSIFRILESKEEAHVRRQKSTKHKSKPKKSIAKKQEDIEDGSRLEYRDEEDSTK